MRRNLGLDLHEDAGRDDEAVERFDRAGGGLEDVDDALVRPHFELLAALLVDVRRPQHRVALDARGDRDRTTNPGIGALGVLDDFLRRGVQRPVVVGFHPNSNPRHNFSVSRSLVVSSVTLGRAKGEPLPLKGTGKFSDCSESVKAAGAEIPETQVTYSR